MSPAPHDSSQTLWSGTSGNIAVFGAGGHAKVVINTILRSNRSSIVGVFDDDVGRHGTLVCEQPVIGGRDELLRMRHDGAPTRYIVALGENLARRNVTRWLQGHGCEFATIIHPDASIAAGATIAAGSVILANAVVGPDAAIGEGVIVNSGAVVEHDCSVGDFTHIAPHATLCGTVRIGSESLIGAGAVVLPGKFIGDNVRVGAQATVCTDITNQSTVIGTPAKAVVQTERRPSPDSQPSSWSPWPFFADDEVTAVTRVLHSGKVNYWTGDECRRFEQEFAETIGRKYAVALANGTLALELALYALDIGEGAEVVTSPRTFIASASCAVMRGARPVFADVDCNSQNITAESIERVLTPRTRAIIPVHLAGLPCDMDPILDLARRHGLKVIEDCAQAQGARYKGRPVGSFGDFAAFSFCQDKIMSTGGEGGMLLTDDTRLWNRAWSFKDHGKSYDAVYHRRHELGFRWLHDGFGTNWRMTEMQGAMGRIQLPKIADWVSKRRRNAARLQEYLHDIPALRIPKVPADMDHAFYRYYVFVDSRRLRSGWTRDRIMSEIVAAGTPCFTGTCGEVYLEQAFQPGGHSAAWRLPNARQLAETSLMFLVHPTMSVDEIDRMGATARGILLQACHAGTANEADQRLVDSAAVGAYSPQAA